MGSDPFLKTLPDSKFAAFLRRGIHDGFCLGVSPLATLVSSKSNVLALAAKVNDYSKNEVKADNPAPFPCEGIHLSPIRFITKKNWPRKFRLIVNLSFPSGHSINNAISDSISPAHSSHYVTKCHATELIPQGSTFAKIDLKVAFRTVLVPSADQHYLGISWRDHTPSAIVLFYSASCQPLSPLVPLLTVSHGPWYAATVDLTDYLDDFIFWTADHATCQQTLELTIHTATRLGLPVEPAKVESPLTTLPPWYRNWHLESYVSCKQNWHA